MEYLIRVIDKLAEEGVTNYDPEHAQRLHQVGDVIVAMPDGHPWSEEERTHPRWRIVRTTLLGTAHDALLQAPATKTDKRRRGFRVDLDKHPEIMAARSQHIVAVQNLKVSKKP